MAGVKGKTGNPGAKNPNKRSSTSFAVEGVEPKGRAMSFRPVQSLEQRIDAFLEKSGLKTAEFLEQAAIAYLEKSLATAGQQLEQGQLSNDSSGTEEPATTSNETPASGSSDTRGKKKQAGNTKTSSKSKRSPGTGTKARKTPSS
jgi:hypothetical protein